MTQFLYRRILIPQYEALFRRRSAFPDLLALEPSQWRTPPEPERGQVQALCRLLDHAALHCPHYRDTWLGLGLRPDDVTDLTAFRRWPLLTREDINAHRSRMKSQAPGLRGFSKST